MWTVRVVVQGKDVRGVRRWSHESRDGATVTLAGSGVLLEDGKVLCSMGGLLEGWSDCSIAVDGVGATLEKVISVESRFWAASVKFALLRPKEPLSSSVCAGDDDDDSVAEQYAFQLQHPKWGLLRQTCRAVCRPEAGVVLVDVSCFEGGEGGLVRGQQPLMLVASFADEKTPTGLSVCVELARVLGQPSRVSAEPMAKGVVVVLGKEGRWGTGFRVGKMILTAGHVVCAPGDAAPSSVRVAGSAVGRARVLRCWPEGYLDFCILAAGDGDDDGGFEVAETEMEPLDKMVLLSATQWNTSMALEGEVMSVVDGVQLVTNVVSWGGCSGGPVLNERGQVAAMLLSTASKGRRRIPRVSLCLPAAVWRPFLSDLNHCPPRREAVESAWKKSLPSIIVNPKLQKLLQSKL